MAEANERNGGANPAAMGFASVILVAVVGLGLRIKLRVFKSFADELLWVVHGQRVTEAHKAARQGSYGRHFDQREGFKPGASSAGGAGEQSWQRERARQFRNAEAAANCDATHRALLGVEPGASRSTLKQAYYRAAKLHHPDAVGVTREGTTAFAELKLAYDTLRERAAPE